MFSAITNCASTESLAPTRLPWPPRHLSEGYDSCTRSCCRGSNWVPSVYQSDALTTRSSVPIFFHSRYLKNSRIDTHFSNHMSDHGSETTDRSFFYWVLHFMWWSRFVRHHQLSYSEAMVRERRRWGSVSEYVTGWCSYIPILYGGFHVSDHTPEITEISDLYEDDPLYCTSYCIASPTEL